MRRGISLEDTGALPEGTVRAELPAAEIVGDPEGIERARLKYEELKRIIREMGSVLVAFSGGVDSTFLLKVCTEVLGDNVRALTAASPTYPERELDESKRLARLIGAVQVVVDSNELDIPGFAENPENRCYFCKGELFGIARKMAEEEGLAFVADGSNLDDEGDYRPGSKAAEELGVRSPLKEAGLTKREIRFLSRELNLPTWSKPAFACLSSRFPYGTRITEDRLDQVSAGEEALRELGFRQFRVRYHGQTVRIEVAPNEIMRFFDESLRDGVVETFKSLGFSYVTLDLEGYRAGSLNEILGKD